ncbi:MULTISPECIES: hypothetical protein [unclassified Streptomyces]|uniref:hypothetical protein n=1 Tax=unclassified Streptomyces TaxID=2593676 RepID=UPI000CD58F0F|nr:MULTISPECIES: hypothetical protein [unclassified Streptomyces]
MVVFLLGVLSSLVATAIVVALGLIAASPPRWWLVKMGSWLAGTGLCRIYGEQRSAESDISQDLAQARWVKVLAGRGNALTREAFASLWSGALRLESVQVLLPDPESHGESWLDRRASDMSRFDPGFDSELLRSQVRANVQYLAQVSARRPDFELRHFDLPNNCRIIATDKAAYVTFYSRFAHGRNSPCMYVRAPKLLHSVALQQFDVVWASSMPAPGATRSE